MVSRYNGKSFFRVSPSHFPYVFEPINDIFFLYVFEPINDLFFLYVFEGETAKGSDAWSEAIKEVYVWRSLRFIIADLLVLYFYVSVVIFPIRFLKENVSKRCHFPYSI